MQIVLSLANLFNYSHPDPTSCQSLAIPVLGSWSGGTSVVAGILKILGVHMGNLFFPTSDWRTLCSYESLSLRSLLCHYYSQETLQPIRSLQGLEADLRHWYNCRQQEAKDRPIGGKHPLLCLCIPQLVKAWSVQKCLVVRRPLADIESSIKRRRWPFLKSTHPRQLFRLIDQHLTGHDYLELEYNQLRADPGPLIEAMIDYLGLEVKPSQMDQAIAFVN